MKWLKRLLEGALPDSPAPPAEQQAVVPPIELPWGDVDTGFQLGWNLAIDFGTSSTVVLAWPAAPIPGIERVDLTSILGDAKTPWIDSEVLVRVGDGHFELRKIGRQARNSRESADSRLFSSLKRTIELESRRMQDDPSREQRLGRLEGLVSDFLFTALIESGRLDTIRLITSASTIAVTVPNSFPQRAIDVVRTGVVEAMQRLSDEGHIRLGEDEEPAVHVVPEGVAVSYFYSYFGPRRPDQHRGHVFLNERPIRVDWSPLQGTRTDKPQSRSGRVAVLDVGAGTTDLTVVHLPEDGSQPRVVLNTGLVSGGIDIDRILLASLLPEGARKDVLAHIGHRGDLQKARRELHLVMADIRDLKEGEKGNLEGLFSEDRFAEFDPILRRLTPRSTGEMSGALLHGPDREAGQDFVRSRINRLVELTALGLLWFLDDQVGGVDRLILTGRGSQLERFQLAAREWASHSGTPVVTLEEPRLLKLAVALGCAVQDPGRLADPGLEVRTLGKRIVMQGGPERRPPLMDIGAQLPLASDVPLLLCTALPRRLGGKQARLRVTEQRMAIDMQQKHRRDLVAYPPSFEEQEVLAAIRLIGELKVPKAFVKRRLRALLLHDTRRQSYAIWHSKMPSDDPWGKEQDRKGLIRNTDPFSTLPLGFPYADDAY